MRLEGESESGAGVLSSSIKEFWLHLVDRGEPLNCLRQGSDSLISPAEKKDRLEGDEVPLGVESVCISQGDGAGVKGSGCFPFKPVASGHPGKFRYLVGSRNMRLTLRRAIEV